jgi:hypothetical protein
MQMHLWCSLPSRSSNVLSVLTAAHQPAVLCCFPRSVAIWVDPVLGGSMCCVEWGNRGVAICAFESGCAGTQYMLHVLCNTVLVVTEVHVTCVM